MTFWLYNSKTIQLSLKIEKYLNRANKDLLKFVYFFFFYLIGGLLMAFLFDSLICELLLRKFCRHQKHKRKKIISYRELKTINYSIKKIIILLILKWFNSRQNYKSTHETIFIEFLSKFKKNQKYQLLI